MYTMPGPIANVRNLEVIRQRERFSWFAKQLQSRTIATDVDILREHLVGLQSRPGQREKALVALALLGSVEAGEVIAGFDTGDDEELMTFHSIAATVWAVQLAA